jgi:hypothetical protein
MINPKDITIEMLGDDSREFIDWSMDYLADEDIYNEFIADCVSKFEAYLSRNPEDIKARLKEKFIIGGYEHGNPSKYTQEQVQKEVEMEYDDALGWPLVGKFCQWKRSKNE